MVENGPKITVITAVYNSSQTLQRCLNSFARQDYPHKELVVIDGGSSDGSADIIRGNEDLISYWESKPDRGVYHAWNKALDHITGDWVHFLGSDDIYYAPNTLSRAVKWLKSCQPTVLVAYGRAAVVTETGDLVEMKGEPWQTTKTALRREMSIPHPGVFHHRSLFEIRGKFDENFQIAGDYEFLLRELKSCDALFMPDLVVTNTTVGGLSSTPGLTLIARREDAMARRINGLYPYPLGWWAGYVKAQVYRLISLVVGKDAAISVRNVHRRIVGQDGLTKRRL